MSFWHLRKSSRGICKKLSLTAASALVSLVLLEVVLRSLAPPVFQASGTVYTPKAEYYGWAIPPGANLKFVNPTDRSVTYFKANSEGWKDVEHSFVKSDTAIRILFVGDSVTYGIVALDDLYTRQVERILHHRNFPHVEIISIGIGGWCTDQALELLIREGLSYAPHIVVYQFTGNDIPGNVSPHTNLPRNSIYWKKRFKYKLIEGDLTKIDLDPLIEPESFGKRIRKFLFQSAVAFNIDQGHRRLKEWLKTWNEPKTEGQWTQQFDLDPGEVFFPFHPQKWTPENKMAWDLFEAIILRMNNMVTTRGATLVVFCASGGKGQRDWLMTRNLIATDGHQDFIFRDGRKHLIDCQRVVRELARICDRHNIPLIKPTRDFEHWENDPHPNVVGNRRMAEDIVDFLLARDLIPPAQRALY